MSSKDKTLISDLMESFVNEAPTNPFVSFCVFCNKGVIEQEMTYQKGKVFHKDCYDKHGSSFPQINQEILSQDTNDKVQLVQLRNLKIRMMETSKAKRKKPKAKKKSKSKTKKRPAKRGIAKKKKTPRRKISKNRRVSKRKTVSKKKKTTPKTKRRSTRRKTTKRR